MSADWPGTLALAASFDQMARNIIFESKKLGQNVENDAHVTVHYYYNNKTVNGKDFVGFLQNKDDRLDFLA
ncbi:hypothetical protein CF335_g9502 [Tilletia laevis]|nr:hypothetical protein CF335_g9502 [Tilletia laevis]